MGNELQFNDQWMDCEPFHTHVTDVATDMIYEMCRHDAESIEYMTNFFFHFTSLWYQRIVEGHGEIVQPAVSSCALFTAHMVDVHDMEPEAVLACVNILSRFTALVVTKAGGRLI